MRANLVLPKGRVTLIDDVVTRGATLFAAASVVEAAYPGIAVRGFGLIRTNGLVPDVEQVIDPTFGTITRDRYGNPVRQP